MRASPGAALWALARQMRRRCTRLTPPYHGVASLPSCLPPSFPPSARQRLPCPLCILSRIFAARICLGWPLGIIMFIIIIIIITMLALRRALVAVRGLLAR